MRQCLIATRYILIVEERPPSPLNNVVSDVALVRKCICNIPRRHPDLISTLVWGEGGSNIILQVNSCMLKIMLKSPLCLKTLWRGLSRSQLFLNSSYIKENYVFIPVSLAEFDSGIKIVTTLLCILL